jgi:hypothetical protein
LRRQNGALKANFFFAGAIANYCWFVRFTTEPYLEMIVNGSKIPTSRFHDRCASVTTKKKIDLDATGDQKTNALLGFLKCQVKASKMCKLEEKEYIACHQSIMGVGTYKGARHCGKEMESLYKCVLGLE